MASRFRRLELRGPGVLALGPSCLQNSGKQQVLHFVQDDNVRLPAKNNRDGDEWMKILIDNTDYTAALDAVRALEIVRRLNEPSTCRLWLSLLPGGALAVPLRNQSLVVSGDDGTVYFTGYLAVSPLAEFAGLGLTGALYRYALQAVSDEILLDAQLLPPSAGTTGATAAQILTGLVARTGSGALSTAGVTLATPVSQFVPEAGAKWSELAGQAATAGRAAYRAVHRALSLAQVGTTVHALSEADGTLALGSLAFTAAVDRALANDVTVCGAEEPVAYVTEYFLGDGVTLSFPLAETPYFGPASQAKIIRELFDEGSIDTRRWGFSADSQYFSLTGAGLTIDGGAGVDGQAALQWLDLVEAGGTLLLEAVGVALSPGSTGTVAGVYSRVVSTASCIAGFEVTSAVGTGAVSISPLVAGAVAGPAFALTVGDQYALRMRLWCPEVERFRQWYRVVGDAGLVAYGGEAILAQGRVQMEIQQFVDGVGGTPVVLHDGALPYVPGMYTVVAANSLNLIGTIRSFFLKGLGTGWVESIPAGGSFASGQTQPMGTVADGADCHLTRTGQLEFYAGNAPALGEIVAVHYRTVGRAVGRAVNAASQAALAALGAPAVAVWTGSVTKPVGRTSADCRNAAMALVTAASSVCAAWSGTYRTTNVALNRSGGDVWPGDALLLQAPSLAVAGGGGLDVQVFVRAVTLRYGASDPDLVGYAIEFSNDWANDLSVKTSRTVPEDAWLPAAVSPAYLANLTSLTVTGISTSAVSVATGVAAPSGGGFEVRRRDFAFQAGDDPDVVIRSVVENFDIPRATAADRFYVRMFDGSTPPNYSEFSVGLFVNLPLSV
jgi:hypothetical protein